MKLKNVIVFAVTIAACEALASSGVVYDDAAVSREFVKTTGYFCGHKDPVRSSLNWILNTCCEGDTNRYLRVAKETAVSNPKFAYMAIDLVNKYGSASDLPFLYQYTNDTECAAQTLSVILKLGGLTEDSLNAAINCMADTNTYHVLERNIVARDLFGAAAISSVTSGLKELATTNALNYACRSIGYVDVIDIGFRNVDPSYAFSKRRLFVLRSLLPHCEGYELNYTTNAINELVAYPEANLPD